MLEPSQRCGSFPLEHHLPQEQRRASCCVWLQMRIQPAVQCPVVLEKANQEKCLCTIPCKEIIIARCSRPIAHLYFPAMAAGKCFQHSNMFQTSFVCGPKRGSFYCIYPGVGIEILAIWVETHPAHLSVPYPPTAEKNANPRVGFQGEEGMQGHSPSQRSSSATHLSRSPSID